MGIKLWVLGFALCSAFLAGCASAPYAPGPTTQGTIRPIGIPGVYHTVQKGQTLWRIAKLYDVDLDELTRANRIPDSSSIETGELIFIPNRKAQRYLQQANTSDDDFIWPLKGRVISSFGSTYNNTLNKGLNIAPSLTDNIIASRSGRIVFCSDDLQGFGKTIIIEHAEGFSTVYTRNSIIFARLGEYVQRGTVIAKAGASGRDKNTYLHFEIRKNHIPKNPYFYLSR